MNVKKGGVVAARGDNAQIDIGAGQVVLIDAGGAVTAGARFDDINGKPTAVKTGDGADVRIVSPRELVIKGTVTSSDQMLLSAGSPLNSYKADYFDLLPKDARGKDHYLKQIGEDQFSILMTGTLTSLADNTTLKLEADNDIIIRGNINVLGQNSDLKVRSNTYIYEEGFMDVQRNIDILGGFNAAGNSTGGASTEGSSVYVHTTSRINTRQAGSQLNIKGAKDVDILGAVVAGGTIGENGVTWAGSDSVVNVTAGEQVFLDTGLLASKAVNIQGGIAGADDKGLGVLITPAGGATAGGYSSDNTGGIITIKSQSNLEIMGWLVSGGKLNQVFENGVLKSQTIDWSGNKGLIRVEVEGQAFIGGNTVNKQGEPIETGGYLYANDRIEVIGKQTTGTGVYIQASSELVTHAADGSIFVKSSSDADIQGLLLPGGDITQVRDANGTYLGRLLTNFNGNSTVRVEADDQIRVGQDLRAGKSIDLVGGDDPIEPTIPGKINYSGRGMVIYGSTQLSTWKENSTINLNAPGRIDILAPAHTNEIQAQGFIPMANGQLNQDVTLKLWLNKVDFEIEATIVLPASLTANNTKVEDLMADLQTLLDTSSWKVTRSNNANRAVGSSYVANASDRDLEVKLRNGHFMFAGPYKFLMQNDSVNADQLGFTGLGSGVYSSLPYAINASQVGSKVSIGAPNGPNGKLYIAGKVISHDAINLYSGTSPDGVDIEVDWTGRLETINASIAMNAGKFGVVRGEIVAGGVGSDIILSSNETLELYGSLTANDRITLNAGKTVKEGEASIRTFGTSRMDAEYVTITGLNNVSIDSSIGIIRDVNKPDVKLPTRIKDIEIRSISGDMTLERVSGLIEGNATMRFLGRDVNINGAINNALTDGNANTVETLIKADRNVQVMAAIDSRGSITVEAVNNLDLFGGSVKVTGTGEVLKLVQTNVGGGINLGRTILDTATGLYSQQGANLEAAERLTIASTGTVSVGAGVQVMTRDNDSILEINANKLNLTGALYGGYRSLSTGGVERVGDRAQVKLNIGDRLNIGGQGANTSGQMELVGGSIAATGLVNIQTLGGTDALDLVMLDKSSIKADAIGATPAQIVINTKGDAQVRGAIEAVDAGADIQWSSQGLVLLGGLVKADRNLTIDAGKNATGYGVITRGLRYYDQNNRMIDSLGYFVDELGEYVNAQGQATNQPQQTQTDQLQWKAVGGGILGTNTGGKITLSATGDMWLQGKTGQLVGDANGNESVKTDDVIITSDGVITIDGEVRAQKSIALTGSNLNLIKEAVVKTFQVGSSTIKLTATEQILTTQSQLGTDKALIDSKGRLDIIGRDLWLDGSIKGATVLLGGEKSVNLQGKVISLGNLDVRAGIDRIWSRTQLLNATRANMNGGQINVNLDGALDAQGIVSLIAGGDVRIEAEAGINGKGSERPLLTQKPVTIQVVTGTYQELDPLKPTIDVPVENWIATRVTEQVGFDKVRVGNAFYTFDVTLTQDSYWNPNTNTEREYFVNGVDYQSSKIAWGSAGAPAADHNFSDLSDAQREVVLNALEFKKLYDFGYSNATENRVVNGNPSKSAWTPTWANEPKVIVNIPLDGVQNYYVRLENGAQNDLLRVVSQGEAVKWDETVGQYWDQATVRYNQINSTHTATASTYYYETDSDNSLDRWQVNYDSNGKRWYSIEDGRTGTNSVQHAKNPLWKDAVFQNENDLNGVRINSPIGYDATTRSINDRQLAGSSNVKVGDKFEKQYSGTLNVVGFSFNLGSYADGGNNLADPTLRMGGRVGSRSSDTYWSENTNSKTDSTNRFITSDSGLRYDSTFAINWEAWDRDGSGNRERDYGTRSQTFDIKTSRDITSSITGLNGGNYVEVKYRFDSSNQWVDVGDVTETFNDYRYNWESQYNNVQDKRLTQQFQFVTNDTDIYDNRARYETSDKLIKVVSTKTENNYITRQTTQNQILWRTERLSPGEKDAGAFNSTAINARGGIVIDSGNDVTISAKLNATGAAGTIAINAIDQAIIKGTLPIGANAATTIAAPAVLTAQNGITVTANQVSVLDRSQLTVINSAAQVNLNSATDITFGGINKGGIVDLKAKTDIDLSNAQFQDSSIITVKAGTQAEIGNIIGNANTILSATGNVSLTAGNNDGDINLPTAQITGTNVTLTAQSGLINNYSTQTVTVDGQTTFLRGLITANNLTLNARDTVAVSLNANQVTATGSQLDLTTDAAIGATTTANLITTGNLNINMLNNMSLQTVTANNIAVNGIGNLTVNTMMANGTIGLNLLQGNFNLNSNGRMTANGLVSMAVQGSAIGGAGSLIKGTALDLAARGTVNLTTEVAEATLKGLADNNFAIANTGNLKLNSSKFNGGVVTLSTTGNLTLDTLEILSDRPGQGINLNATGDLTFTKLDAGEDAGTINLVAGNLIVSRNGQDDLADLIASTANIQSGQSIDLETNIANLTAKATNGNIRIENLTKRSLDMGAIEAKALNSSIYVSTLGVLNTLASTEVDSSSGTIELVSKTDDIVINPSNDPIDFVLAAKTLKLRATGQLIVDRRVELNAESITLASGETGITEGAVLLPRLRTQNLTYELGSGSIILSPESFKSSGGETLNLDNINLIARGNQITKGANAGLYQYRDINTKATYLLDTADQEAQTKVYRETNGILTQLSAAEITVLRLAPVLNMLEYQVREPQSGKLTFLGNNGQEYYRDRSGKQLRVDSNNNPIYDNQGNLVYEDIPFKTYTRQDAAGRYAYTVLDITKAIPEYEVVYSAESNYRKFTADNAAIYTDVQINFVELDSREATARNLPTVASLNLQALMRKELAGGISLATPVGELKAERNGFSINSKSLSLKAQRDLSDISFADLKGINVEIASGADIVITGAPQAQQSLKLTSSGYFDQQGNFIGGSIRTQGDVLKVSNLELNALSEINVDINADRFTAKIANKGNLTIRETDAVTLADVSVNNGQLNLMAANAVTIEKATIGGDVKLQASDVFSGKNGDSKADLIANNLNITVTGSVGTASQLLETTVNTIQLKTGTSANLSNYGGTTINSVEAGTAVQIETHSPLTIAGNITAASAIRLQSGDSAGSGDDVTINSGVVIQTSQGDIIVRAGDNLKLNRGARIQTTGKIVVAGDANDGDAGVGSIIDLDGELNAQSVTIESYGDDDIINIKATNTAITINSGSGNDIINLGNNASLNRIRASLTIDGEADTDALNIDNTADASNSSLKITKDKITGLTGMTGEINYQNIESIGVKLGNGIHITEIAIDVTAQVNLNTGNNTANTLVLDFSRQAAASNVTLSNGAITGLLTGGSISSNNSYSTIDLRLGNGNDTFTMKDTNFAYNLNLNAGGGNNTLNLDFSERLTGYNDLVQISNDVIFGLGLNDRFKYSNISQLNVDLGAAQDDITLLNDYTGSLSFNLGDGDDSLMLLDTKGQTTLEGGAGNDSIKIQKISAKTDVLAGAGDDEVQIGTDIQTVSNIKAELNVDTGAGLDKILIDNTADLNNRNVSLANQFLNGLGMTNGLGYSNVEAMEIRLGFGSDVVTVTGDDLRHDLEIKAGAGTDSLLLDLRKRTTAYTGLLDINETSIDGFQHQVRHSGLASIDVLLGNAADDVMLSNRYTGVLNFDLGDGDNIVTLLDAKGVTRIATGAGYDIVNVQNATAATIIQTGAGEDIIQIGADVQQMSGIQGLMSIDAGDGLDYVSIDNSADTRDQSAVLTNNSLVGLGTGEGILYNNVEYLSLRLGKGRDDVEVQSISANTAIRSGDGDDTVTIQQDPQAASQTDLNLQVDTAAGNDRVNVKSNSFGYTLMVEMGADKDQLDINANTPNNVPDVLYVTDTMIFGAGLNERFQYDNSEMMNLTLSDAPDDILLFNEYTGIFDLDLGGGDDQITVLNNAGNARINTSEGNDLVNVQSVSAATLIDTGVGDDIVQIGTDIQVVNQINAPLLIDTGAGNDHLTVDNTADQEDRTIKLTNTRLSGLDSADNIRYANLESMNLRVGSGQNTIWTSANVPSGSQPLPTNMVESIHFEVDRPEPSDTNELGVQVNGAVQEIIYNGINSASLQTEAEETKLKGFLVRAWEKMVSLLPDKR